MKMNKKGFTLIEMLVVIAIIAVLVSIIIPVVGSSTVKAQAATDAANLRSAKAQITIAVLDGQFTKSTAGEGENAVTTITWKSEWGTEPECKTDSSCKFKAVLTGESQVTVYFGDYTIADFAYVAEKGGTVAEAHKALNGTETNPSEESPSGT